MVQQFISALQRNALEEQKLKDIMVEKVNLLRVLES